VSVDAVPEEYRSLRSFAFGDSAGLADELLDLVMKGVKTATCSTQDEPNISTPGERWLVLDGRGNPCCVIETTEVSYRRYNEVDAAFAYDEGEGDRSLAYWREAHRRYFGRLAKFSEDMMLMCERFRLVEIFEERETGARKDTIDPSVRQIGLPLPLAGEGRGGSLSAGVLETIATAIAERAPTLTLPRKRERGQEKHRS
jgi:uncharacterized protein YhfF